MSKKEIYEKPCVIGMLNNSMVYGQDLHQMGQCRGGADAEGLVGCQSGTTVLVGQCLNGEFPTVAASCSGGSTFLAPGDHCWAGGNVD